LLKSLLTIKRRNCRLAFRQGFSRFNFYIAIKDYPLRNKDAATYKVALPSAKGYPSRFQPRRLCSHLCIRILQELPAAVFSAAVFAFLTKSAAKVKFGLSSAFQLQMQRLRIRLKIVLLPFKKVLFIAPFF
jgi:hypothetical protein